MKMFLVVILLILTGCGADEVQYGNGTSEQPVDKTQEKLYDNSVIAKQYGGKFVMETERTFMFTIMEGRVTCIEHKTKYDFSCFNTPPNYAQ